MKPEISRRNFIRGSIFAGLFNWLDPSLPIGFASTKDVKAEALSYEDDIKVKSKDLSYEKEGKANALSYGDEAVDLAVVIGDPVKATEKAIELLGGIGKFVRKGDRVVIKPNMGFPNPPGFATTTSPGVVRTIAALCAKAGAKKILVMDNPLRRPEVCLHRNGIREACSGIDNTFVTMVTGNKFFIKKSVPGGKVLREIRVIKAVLEADVLINIPVAKSHNATGVSLGMKNLMGVILDRESFHTKYDLDQAIADLNKTVKADLTIIDGSRALTNGGPGGPGMVEKKNTIIAGIDPVAVDSIGLTLANWYGKGFRPSEVGHIVAAHEIGVGRMDLDGLKIKRVEVG